MGGFDSSCTDDSSPTGFPIITDEDVILSTTVKPRPNCRWRIYSTRHSWPMNASIRLIEAFNRYARPTTSSSHTQMRAPSAGPLLFRPGCRPPIRYSIRFAYLKFCFETSINNRVDCLNSIRCSIIITSRKIQLLNSKEKKIKIVYHNCHIPYYENIMEDVREV